MNYYQPHVGLDGQPFNQVRNLTLGTGIVAAVTPVVKAEQNNQGDAAFSAFCHGCGLVHVGFRHGDPENLIHDGCKFYQHKHPDYNLEPCDWADSTIGKAYFNASRENLHWKYAINRRNGVMEPRRDKKRKLGHQQSRSSSGDNTSPYPLECPTLPCVLKCRDGSSLAEKVHMDTGAFGRHSLMTEALALKLVSRGSDIVVQPEVAYRPALGGQPLVSCGYALEEDT